MKSTSAPSHAVGLLWVASCVAHSHFVNTPPHTFSWSSLSVQHYITATQTLASNESCTAALYLPPHLACTTPAFAAHKCTGLPTRCTGIHMQAYVFGRYATQDSGVLLPSANTALLPCTQTLRQQSRHPSPPRSIQAEVYPVDLPRLQPLAAGRAAPVDLDRGSQAGVAEHVPARSGSPLSPSPRKHTAG